MCDKLLTIEQAFELSVRQQERDLHSDLSICDAATPGPWLVDRNVANQIRQPNGSKRRRITTPPDADGIRDSEFIAEARQGWPEAIRRAIAAEAEFAAEEDRRCYNEMLADSLSLENERLLTALRGILSAIDRGALQRTKMSAAVDYDIQLAREAVESGTQENNGL